MKGTANNVKTLTKLLRFNLPRFLRWVLVLIIYLITFSALDQLTHTLQLFPGVVAWYPPDGLSLAFLLTFGAGFTPVFALASLISSLIIYRFSTPLGPILVWAVILSTVYGIDALLLRRRVRIDPQLKSLRDTLWLILSSTIVATVLAVISVSTLVNYGEVPSAQYFNAFVQWWIGEMIGVLVFTPFLLVHAMPWLKRFVDGEWANLKKQKVFRKPSLQSMGQVVSIPVILYLVFGIPALRGFQPLYLIAGPLIWIALKNGFSKVSLAIVVMNFGTILAIWLFKFDTSRLGELQFLMFGIYTSTLLTGAIVTRQKRTEEELRHTEILNRALIENAPDAITLLGADGLLKYLSPSTQRILGYAPEEQVGSNPVEFTHPDDLPDLLKLLGDLSQTPGVVVTTQYRFRHKDGSWRWLESTIKNLLAEPSVQAIVFNFRDITERKQADVTLLKSENRFRALVEHSLEEISLVDSDGTLIYESPTSRRPLGYPPDSFVGHNLFDLFHPDERAAAAQLLEQVVKHPGSVKEASFRLRHQDGSWRWMEGSLTNLLDEPAVQSVVINYRDVTERKLAEQEIVNLAKFPSENPNPVLRLSREGIVMYANAASGALLGLWGCTVGDTAPQFWRDLAAQALASRENKNVDIECDGKVYSMVVTPVAEPDYVNLYGRDVTERKQAEEEIKISNDELSMLFELSHSLAEADNLDEILGLVNRHAVESVHTTFARIALLEDEKFIMRAAYPIRPLDRDLRIGEQDSVASLPYSKRILEQNEPMILRASDPGISSEEKKALLLDFAQSLCLIPLRISDSSPMAVKLMGLLMLGEARNEGREPFTPEKMRLAHTIGDSAAIAIRRMLLREQTERHLQQLIALSEIDLAIISSSDMVFSLEVLLLQAIEQLNVDAADIWLFDPTSQTLEFVSSHGFRTPAFENPEPLHLGEGNAGRAALERRTIHVPNLTAHTDHPRLTKALAEEPFISYYAVPLIVKGEVKGVLELFHRTELEPNEEWLKFLNTLANQAAIAIDNSSLFNDLQHSNAELTQAYDATIQGWSRALDLRDNETEGHTQRVTELTTKLGRQFGLSEEELVHVRRGALLHDIGKMGVPDGILLKPGPLNDEEWIVMRKHTTFAYELLSPIHFLRPALDIPYCHHEKWDGTGYPRGLSGDQIPLAARIFAVIDVWDALTSDRPYRAAWPEEKVLDHIRSLAGIHFDPQVVKICLEPGLLKSQSKRRMRMKPVQWSEKMSVGVRELDQQHQQLITLLNRLISAQGTISTHSETISNILMEMTRYAQAHFIAEERLMEAYGFPGLEEQKIQHRDFRKKTVDFSTATTLGVDQIPEDLLVYLADWWVHHILEDDMAYRSFFKDKGVE
jgi:hemerythrin-like metal-binding protein/PAS domain S-box-containing protein